MGAASGVQEISVWVPTDTVVSGGGQQVGYPSSPEHTNVPCVIAKESAGWARRQFGLDSLGRYRGIVNDWWGLEPKSVVKVTAGTHIGTYLMVEDAIPNLENEEVTLVLIDTREQPDAA